jgi:SAM-dependent methyltransferase
VRAFNPFRLRAEFAHARYAPYLQGSVCDVGSGGSPAYFRPVLGTRYTAVDVAETRCKPDVFCDFEREPLPFPDASFDTVVSFDCLEHCDNPYRVFAELCRVSKRHVIVALPNNWPGFLESMLKGRHVTHRTGYGLPEEEPGPGVRHKWWFNLEEAERFLVANAARHGFAPVKVEHVFDPADNLIRFAWYPKINYLTRERIQSLVADPAYRKNLGALRRPFEAALSLAGPKAVVAGVRCGAWLARLPIAAVDQVLKRLVWGWGSKYRYLNMFCRQVWVVLEKK